MSRRRPKNDRPEKPAPFHYRITPAPPIPGAAVDVKRSAAARSKDHKSRQLQGRVSAAAMICWILLMILPVLALRRLCETTDWRNVTGSLAFLSLITWLLYRGDKARAQTGERRTRESTLHLFELAGGWSAAFLAQRRFRHKIAKPAYQFIYWCIVALHQYAAIDYLLGWRFSLGFYQWARTLT